jgi:hypothetical protein
MDLLRLASLNAIHRLTQDGLILFVIATDYSDDNRVIARFVIEAKLALLNR